MPSTIRSIFVILIVSCYLSGCASLPDDDSLNHQAATFVSKEKINSSSLMQRAKLKIKKGKSENLAFFAPSYFKNAQDSYQEALVSYQNKDEELDAKLKTQLSIEYIDSGMRNKKVVLDTLKKSLNNRQILKDLKVNKHFPNEFNELRNQHIVLINLIEQRKLDEALKGEKDLLSNMRKVEVKTIDTTYLSEVDTALKQANKEGALELLPITHQKTMDTLKDTRQFIRQNPRKSKRIAKLAQAALFSTQRLYQLSREAKRFSLLEKPQIEQLLLSQEDQFQRISQKLNHPDIRNLSFNDQSLLLAEESKQIRKRLKKPKKAKSGKISQADLDKWKRKVVLLQAEVRRLQKVSN